MDIEIKIGRDVEGPSIINVPSTFKKVSRRHATLLWHDGNVSIEDNESHNGTYVNGKRVAKTKVMEDDVVLLGGKEADNECYQIDLKKVFASCIEAENANRTDYSEEFASIKQAYIDYQREVAELKKNVTKKTQLPKLLASFIPAVIGLIILLVSEDMTLRIMSMSIGTVMSGLVGILTMGKSSTVNEKITDEITELQIKHQQNYCCPKCGMKYPFTTHWKKLEADRKCPNPKCNAVFVKK